MSETVQVEAARIPDRDRLVAALKEHGLDARAVDEVGIEIPCGDGESDGTCEDVLAQVDALVMEIGAPFVPIKHDGVIYVRPPLA